MKKVLVTGINSYIGNAFAEYCKDDFIIEKISLRGEEWRAADFSLYDVIFHVAGIAHSDNGKINPKKEKTYRSINTDLTIEVAKKAKSEGVKQFIFMSSAIVYGDSAPIGKEKIITKDTPVSPVNCYGDSKVQAEIGLQTLADEQFKVCILRPPMIYGKGSKGNFAVLEKLAKKIPAFPKIENARSMLYIDNFTEFVRLMIVNEEQGVFWPQNKEYSNTSEIVQRIAEENGKKIALVPGITWAIRLMSHVTGLVNKAFGNLCYAQEMSQYKNQNYQVVSLYESLSK